MNKTLRNTLFFLLIALLCCSCDRAPLDPQIPYGLLLKARDFMAFCVFLADHEKPYYNHISQRYYYAMLAIASITFQWRKGNGVSFELFPKHDDVWKLQPLAVKNTYGRTLKNLRTRCDYHYDEQAGNLNAYKNDLSSILHDGDDAFTQLEKQTRSNYAKFFGPRVNAASIKKEDCDALMEEIIVLNKSLKDRL